MYHIDRSKISASIIGDWLEKNGFDRYGYKNKPNEIPPYSYGDYVICPYLWDEDDNEGDWNRPNFYHKPSGLKITWYKYPLRGAYSNIPLTNKILYKVLYGNWND